MYNKQFSLYTCYIFWQRQQFKRVLISSTVDYGASSLLTNREPFFWAQRSCVGVRLIRALGVHNARIKLHPKNMGGKSVWTISSKGEHLTISHENYDSDREIRFKSLEQIASYIKLNFALNKLNPLVFGRSI